MKQIQDFHDGDRVIGQFLVADVKKGVTSTSKSYLTITLQDASGTIEGKKWSYDDNDLDTFVTGNIVSVDGEVILYRDALQMKVLSGSLLDMGRIDFARFVPSAPIPKEELERQLDAYIASFEDKSIRMLVEYLTDKFRKEYLDWPAAVRNHHNFASGLAYHSLTMARAAERMVEIYPTLNRDVLLAGAILHDVGKVYELSGPVATSYTIEGNLIGHISIMQAEIREACHVLGIEGEIPTLMEHMILSHHGKAEFGSPIAPMTREALALSMIDDFDAKMAVLDNVFKGVTPGTFTQRIFAMDNRMFYLPTNNKEAK